ncbi:MAG: CoA ester lyase [Pseudomonadota bacterium]
MASFRTFLFAPGDREDLTAKVSRAGADAAVLDLEDAVATANKSAAREKVATALGAAHDCPIYVRINARDTDAAFADLMAVCRSGLAGIVLPKIESAADAIAVDWVIGNLERDRGCPPGSIDLMPIVETAKGIAALRAFARHLPARVKRLSFGAGDYTVDCGMTWSRDEAELAHARAEVVVASRMAEREPPIDSVYARLDDEDGFRASVARIRDLGFQGKLCIHPKQIGPAHDVFRPENAELANARRIIAAFDEAEAQGRASIQIDGQFVDYPIVAAARRTIARAR